MSFDSREDGTGAKSVGEEASASHRHAMPARMALYRSEDGYYILCPYCIAPLTEEVEAARLAQYRSGGDVPVPCTTCELDVTRDAPLERTITHGLPTIPCRHCAQPIVDEAVYCASCRKWQEPPFERA